MAGGKKGAKSGNQKGNEDKKATEVFQAFVICEDFDQNFHPLNLKTPKCLLPIANREPLAYVLDHLINHCKLQQINLVTKSFGQKIKSFVKKHFKVNNCKIDYIESSFQTVGDIFRYLDEERRIDPKGQPFLFVNANSVNNVNLKKIYEQHKKLFEKNSNACMTMVMSKAVDDQKHFIAHDASNKILSFRPSSESNLPCELELSIFKPKLRSRVHLRSNLIDTGIAICSPSVPTTFSDASNLDLATINGFVKRMLDDAAISGEEVYFHLIEDNEFAINVSSFDKYMFANNAIFSRKCYPYTPSYFMKGFTSYVTKKRENYRGENSRCSPQAIFSKQCLVGHDSEIKCNVHISRTTIGDNVTVGKNSKIINSIIMNGATIGEGCTITNSIIGPASIVLDGTNLPPKSVIGEGITVALDGESEYPLILSDIKKRASHELDTNEEESEDLSDSDNDSEYEDGDDEFDDWTVQPTSAPENVIGDNLYQWVFNDIYESDTESVATNDSKISPPNMRASADIIWRTFQTFHDNDDLDSLASEEEEEELSSEDFESGEEEGEGVDVDYAQQLIDKRNREMKERKEQNYQKFKVEVFDSISRCLDHNLNSLDIQKEISGSRSSYEMDAPQIIQAVAETLFTKATNDGRFDLKKFKEVAKQLQDMLAKYLCPDDNPSVKLQCQFLEEVHKTWDLIGENTIKVLHFLYEDDLLEGQVITHWYGKVNDNLNPKFKTNVTKLIDFLEESSDEDSD